MKGSPGGILMIAIGVVLLQIAATGRFKAVWSALSTGNPTPTAPVNSDPNVINSPTDNPPATIPEGAGNTAQIAAMGDPIQVTIVSSGVTAFVDAPDLKSPIADGGGTGCRQGQLMVRTSDGNNYCALSDDIGVPIPTKATGGDVPEILMQTPTGRTIAYKNRSNTRGLMDVPVNVI